LKCNRYANSEENHGLKMNIGRKPCSAVVMAYENYSGRSLDGMTNIARWQKNTQTGKVLPLFGKKLSCCLAANKIN